MAITSLGDAISGLKAAKELVNYLKNKYDDSVINEKIELLKREISTAFDVVIMVQGQYFELSEENRSLRDKMREIENWDLQIAHYNLVNLGKGCFAYKYSALDGQEPMHYLCAHCVQNKIKSILQLGTYSYHRALECHNCKSTIDVTSKATGFE